MRRFLTFRTKPRNPVKTVEWFQYFAQLEGQDYNQYTYDKNGEKIYPVRQTYVKLAHPEIDFEKTSDPESNARQEKAIYELLGFAYVSGGLIKVTKAGREILENKEKRDEIMLRQLLKYQYPNYVNSTSRYKNMNVFLMEVVLEMLDELGSLSRYEAAISLMFCCHYKEIPKAIEVVKEYRHRLDRIGNRRKHTMIKVFKQLAEEYYPGVTLNNIGSHLTTMDAVFRFLEYTSLFIQSGRGNYTTISFREMAEDKINLLLDEYEFEFNENWDILKFFEIYGDPYYYPLPWDKQRELYRITLNNLKDIKSKVNEFDKAIDTDNKYINHIDDLMRDVRKNSDNADVLREISDEVRDLTVSVNEDIFINITSLTGEKRSEILDKMEDILEDRSSEESLALWFENIAWKSLVALNGKHYVKRNFKIEPDLSPRFFAPGSGNTPDIEFYNDEFVIITEVTLTSGVSQWKAEGGSVVDHINSFIEAKIGRKEKKGNVKKGDDRKIIGLFLAKKINSRILWLFHALNNNSWLNVKMPIIPLELEVYMEIIKKLYDENLDSIYFEKFLFTLHRQASSFDKVDEWEKRIKDMTERFIENPVDYINYNY